MDGTSSVEYVQGAPACKNCEHWSAEYTSRIGDCKIKKRATLKDFKCDKFQRAEIPF